MSEGLLTPSTSMSRCWAHCHQLPDLEVVRLLLFGHGFFVDRVLVDRLFVHTTPGLILHHWNLARDLGTSKSRDFSRTVSLLLSP
jgi:hypothetical protein